MGVEDEIFMGKNEVSERYEELDEGMSWEDIMKSSQVLRCYEVY